MRLCNSKTRNETGFESILRSLRISTPFGKRALKDCRPFEPGREKDLENELARVENTVAMIKNYGREIDLLLETFAMMKDNSFTIERSGKDVLSVVELFEIKTLLLQLRKIRELLSGMALRVPKEFQPEDITELLDALDPTGERINTFYIYDAFSPLLAEQRKRKHELEVEIRRQQKEQKKALEARYGIAMTPRFELLVSKADPAALQKAMDIPELRLQDEDYMTTTFKLKKTPEIYDLKKQVEDLNEIIDGEELRIREELSLKIRDSRKLIEKSCNSVGQLDLNLAKAFYAINHSCVRPEIAREHVLEIVEGRHLMVEEILQGKGKKFCPVTIKLKDGVACITGANMGGKTVSLKLAGLCAILAQYGFFVPCESARIGLSSYVHILVGDSQNIQRGLSSFGSEMEELKDILEQSKPGTLLLIDEIASGTNPLEGMALTKAVVDYLNDKPYITLITTHFDNVATGSVKNLQARGLADADFDKLIREIRYASRRERIEIIGKYMDYRLYEVEKNREIPKEALNIAKMLGIQDEIIERAKDIIEGKEDR